ncbi:S-adenosyl-methyltransferase [Lapidilactobacillus dextrinicus DSM 20335]|uniref:Ribosomal RNA small subunit methyltransferase H n=1 Tax=Lapidilactobacillus dextrinicus DSM 20335 TaxID=1423738 RepID=A0A0R2BKJ9_9LACO|nr:16S rRNA (cytosine(1402)-N(4))-methyltransferase RsmH [Lapidilactobacillus dextrinicus]KRM78324.1 S-adenosyl-methyltransferase [Lapidilactobacillus dextrinicus DSM 20335]QFG47317.1 16S rRNA (cytosine(1402)-N(4))-methyltransferase RsmH [Lapidilactobacillus dextrinicus]
MFKHTTVLLKETVSGLAPHDNGIYVDATFGGGGHTRELLSRFSGGRVIAFDQDERALKNGQKLLAEDSSFQDASRVTLVKANFRAMREELTKLNIQHVDGIMYDLGVSSPQLDEQQRGFSYRLEAPLDMRMNQEQALTADQVVNEWSFQDLRRIIDRYGEERFAKQIARAIERQRAIQPIQTTTELAEIIKNAIPAATRRTGGHPAKRTFQAIRIAVNDELGALQDSLDEAVDLLTVGGRLSVITFQSLEDRIVKQTMKKNAEIDVPAGLPIIPPELQPKLNLVNRKPITPSETELAENHRAHSAKLRIAEKMKL